MRHCRIIIKVDLIADYITCSTRRLTTGLRHVSPIEWDNAFSTASTSSIAPWSAKERVLMLYFNTNVGATLTPIGNTREVFGEALRSGVLGY